MCDRRNQRDDPEVIQKTLPEILPYMPTAKRLILAGMGDPLARPDTRDVCLWSLKVQNPIFAFDLVTNGLSAPSLLGPDKAPEIWQPSDISRCFRKGNI